MSNIICPRCDSENIVKNGNTDYGKPRYIAFLFHLWKKMYHTYQITYHKFLAVISVCS